MKTELACRCGDTKFTLNLYVGEGVGLLTCSRGHPSLLLDSRDYWGDVIQIGKARSRRCKCKSQVFSVVLSYTFRQGGKNVSSIDVLTKCNQCGAEQFAMTTDIDYSPTNLLIERPLDPCEHPWIRARRVTLSALWEQKDVELFVTWVMNLKGVRAYWFPPAVPQQVINDGTVLCDLLRKDPTWDLFFGIETAPFQESMFFSWKSNPVIHVGSLKVMVDMDGAVTTMYLIEYAKEVIQEARVVPQPRAFLDFTKAVTGWLGDTFVSERGKGTYDNPEIFAKFRRWW